MDVPNVNASMAELTEHARKKYRGNRERMDRYIQGWLTVKEASKNKKVVK